MVAAWYMDDSAEDQRTLHKLSPNKEVALAQLAELGVLYWRMDAAIPPEEDAALTQIRKDRGYTFTDTITISPEKLPNYEAKLKIFFEEHLHTDEEIRYILEGSGFFDVRDKEDRWIRIAMDGGDMIVLPAGMYHRFTLDESNYLKAMRLFVGEPVWTPYNRRDAGTDAMAARDQYVGAFVKASTSVVA